MNRNKLTASLALGAALIVSGCAGASGNSASVKNNSGDAARSRESAAGNSTSVGGAANDSASAGPASSSPSTAAAGQSASQTATTPSGGDNARAANAPKPRVGSGGNDFYLFTQARAALAADAQLKGANFIIDVKEGVLTLGGAAASAEQKSRAEEVVRGVGGFKSVKNQIKVSGGS